VAKAHTIKIKGPRRLVGFNYDCIKTRVCPSCNYELPISHLGDGDICSTCRDSRYNSRVWKMDELDRLIRAAREVLDIWPMHVPSSIHGDPDYVWNESELERFRNLCDALDRRRQGAG
jgi:hypothetical protein